MILIIKTNLKYKEYFDKDEAIKRLMYREQNNKRK